MRDTAPAYLEKGRMAFPRSPKGSMYGYFHVAGAGETLAVISSGPDEWEHVSVSTTSRIPTWGEMKKVKELFWDDEECVIQYHPPRSEYVDIHPYVLHLWKPPFEVARPPRELI